jgi:hypothetical protein
MDCVASLNGQAASAARAPGFVKTNRDKIASPSPIVFPKQFTNPKVNPKMSLFTPAPEAKFYPPATFYIKITLKTAIT